MPDFTVSQYGTDTSGRPIYMSVFMHQWLDGIVRELGWTPTVVQGAWMEKNGGGADASAGYHDKGGCLDFRVWDLTDTQREALIHATRWGGAASWIRDQAHGGMDPHIHIVLGADADLAPGAAWQWLNYVNGGNGLSGASAGRDYHPRPKPLVLEPPDSLMGDDMAEYGPKIIEKLDALKERVNEIAKNDREREKERWAALKSQLDQIDAATDELATSVADDATKRQVAHVKDLVKHVRDQITTEENA